MEKIEAYLKEKRVKNKYIYSEYSTVKGAVLASLIEPTFAMYKDTLYFNGKPSISFIEAEEIKKDLEKKY